MIPLYYARVASLVVTLSDKNTHDAEIYYEEQAMAFERGKELLLEEWSSDGEPSTLNEYLTRIWG